MAVVGAISQQIWDMKYRLRAPANGAVPGEPLDKTIEDTWRRVATALAAAEREPAMWAERFYRAMEDFKFLPAGRVVAGAGSSRQVTLFNCFVMGTIPDDMGGIFAHLREAALTMQQGGGIGYDFSTLRPQGRAGQGGRRRRLGAVVVHGRVGRDVPHDHERRLSPRRDDGDPALRPSRHRGLYRGQARARPAAHVQPLGAGHRRLHDRRSRRTRRGSCRSAARSTRCCRRASCGTRSCGRPMPMPSPA